MFEVKGLYKKAQGKEILKNVSFKVGRGEIAVFLGNSGVGKSTLLRVCNHLESFEHGTFSLDNRALDLTTVSKNHTVGMVFQQFNLFEHLTVVENITLALIKCQGKTKQEALKIAGSLLESYGLSNKANSSAAILSGGQKQRLAIARTVALNPQVICLDEPTSALDPALTGQIARDISLMAQENRIVLLTTHDMGFLSELDATLFLMNEGTIVETVKAKEYYADPHLFPALCRFLRTS